ncbi:MAG: DUF11 domain-containing protein [Dehalococcoidia bacterium]|nr:DUF11 domain-containing protein [Dehalococcoidia bacterium]
MTPPVSAGDPIGFGITVDNNGDAAASNVTITDDLPDGFSWTVDNTDDCSISSGELTCTFASIPAGGSETINLDAETDAVEHCGDSIQNTAEVYAGTDTSGDPVDMLDGEHRLRGCENCPETQTPGRDHRQRRQGCLRQPRRRTHGQQRRHPRRRRHGQRLGRPERQLQQSPTAGSSSGATRERW